MSVVVPFPRWDYAFRRAVAEKSRRPDATTTSEAPVIPAYSSGKVCRMMLSGGIPGVQRQEHEGDEHLRHRGDRQSVGKISTHGYTKDSNEGITSSSSTRRDHDRSPPKTLGNGRYLVQSVLGSGGTASTYRCTTTDASTPPVPLPRQEQQRTKRSEADIKEMTKEEKLEQKREEIFEEVAVKVLSLRDMKNWKQLDLFQREARVLKLLRHPAIPRYLDFFEEGDEGRGKTFLLAQQLAPGRTLAQMVEEDHWRPTEPEVQRIAERVLEVLTYLHGLRPAIVHRDIKPENIVIEGGCSGGRVFLVDFGGVQDTVAGMPSSTVIGTYGYMSPEQFRGEAVPASDLYALGGTVLFLLSGGRLPSDFHAARMEVSFRGKVKCGPVLETLLEGLLKPFPEDRLSAEKSLRLLRFGSLPAREAVQTNVSAAAGEKSAGTSPDFSVDFPGAISWKWTRRSTVVTTEGRAVRSGDGEDWREFDDVNEERQKEVEEKGAEAGGLVQVSGDECGRRNDRLFGVVRRPPAGARARIRREGGTLVVDIPPEGLSGEVASVSGFAFLWNSLIAGMTASILTGGSATLFQVVWMAPFWFAGGKLGLETIRRICSWERLEVGMSRWSLRQRWAPLRQTKRDKRRASQSGVDTASASWEANWHTVDKAQAKVAGNTDDLVACRSCMERDSDGNGRSVKKWSLHIIEGVSRHEFGETLPPEEQTWIAEEVNDHIQACLRVLAGVGGAAAEDQ